MSKASNFVKVYQSYRFMSELMFHSIKKIKNVDIFRACIRCKGRIRTLMSQYSYLNCTFVKKISMRLMAFDYGTKRIGIAVTDPMQIIATALTTIHPQDIWTFLADYLQAEQVETFIIGKPKQLDGSDSESASHVVGFMRKLKKTYPEIPVVEIDERFTSK